MKHLLLPSVTCYYIYQHWIMAKFLLTTILHLISKIIVIEYINIYIYDIQSQHQQTASPPILAKECRQR